MGGDLPHSQLYFPQDQGLQGGTGGYRNARPPPLHGDTQLPALMGRPWQIPEYYEQVYEITAALACTRLQSYNLILGIDFTKGNEQTAGRSLHDISSLQNPYEQVISIIQQTLSRIDQDNLLPCFGFGDASTNDEDIFCFYPGERPCNGLSGALNRYRELTPHLRLAGPTSFAPIIDMALSIVERSGRQYHVLLIIANAQVMTRVAGRLSFQESQTINAIVAARKWPLSIVLIGVGDDPEDMMKDFVHKIPPGDFDNFHHVNFSEIMSEDMPQSKKEAAFALSVLMKLPQQYRAVANLGLLGRRFQRIPRPPPVAVGAFMGTMSNSLPESGKAAALMEEQHDVPPKYDACSNESESRVCLHCGSLQGVSPPEPEPNDTLEPENTEVPNEFCTVCQARPKDMVFGCGHQVCCDCGPFVKSCPFCRCPITIRIKLF